jgi:hypothetical protein
MPSPTDPKLPKGDDSLLLRYAGMATQFFVAIGVALWLGTRLDGWLHWHGPVWVWVLPLLVITGLIVKVVRDTAKRKP